MLQKEVPVWGLTPNGNFFLVMDLFCQIASKLSERDKLAPEEMTEMEAYGHKMRASGKLK